MCPDFWDLRGDIKLNSQIIISRGIEEENCARSNYQKMEQIVGKTTLKLFDGLPETTSSQDLQVTTPDNYYHSGYHHS